MIHCEWRSTQPDFMKDVICDGVKIARIHALTKKDYADLGSIPKYEYSTDGATYVHLNAQLVEIRRMYLSLTGHGAGWEFDRPVTEDNIAELPEKYYNAINQAIVEFEKQNTITEDVRKN